MSTTRIGEKIGVPLERLWSGLDHWQNPPPADPPCQHTRVIHDRGSVFCRDCPKMNAELFPIHSCDVCEKWVHDGVIPI